MPHLRTYIAGLGSSGALIAAVLVAFFALGGIVAINGLPESSEPASEGAVLVEADNRDDGAAARAIAAALPERGEGDAGPATDGEQGGRGDRIGPRPPEGTPQPVAPAPAPTDPPGLTDPPPQSPAEPQPPPPPRPAPPSGPVGGIVEEIDGAVGGIVGFHPGIAEAIVPITDPIDGAITDPIQLPGAPGPTGDSGG